MAKDTKKPPKAQQNQDSIVQTPIRNKRKQITSPEEHSKLDKKTRHNSASDTCSIDSDWSEIDTNVTVENRFEPLGDVLKTPNMSSAEIHNDSMNTTLEADLHSQGLIGSQLTQPLTQTHQQHMLMNPTGQMFMSSPLHMTPPMVMGQHQQASVLTELDIQRIVSGVKVSLREEISEMVKSEVSKQISELINPMKEEIVHLKMQLASLKIDQDNNEQYSRRLCALISNAKEKPDESTDKIVTDVAMQSGSNVTVADINRSHRVGKKKDDAVKPRDVVVQFHSYKAKVNFMQGRKTLREKRSSYFINEQLTPARREIAFHCRQLKKDENSKICDTWSYDGSIYIRLKSASRDGQKGPSIRINSLGDLSKFGYIPQTSGREWNSE